MIVGRIARVALGLVFAASALSKGRDRRGLATAMADFGVPRVLAGPAGGGLVAVEGTLAVLLLGGWGRPYPAWAALGLLAAFTVAITLNLARHRHPRCPCFGATRARPLSSRTVVRNGILLALAIIATG